MNGCVAANGHERNGLRRFKAMTKTLSLSIITVLWVTVICACTVLPEEAEGNSKQESEKTENVLPLTGTKVITKRDPDGRTTMEIITPDGGKEKVPVAIPSDTKETRFFARRGGAFSSRKATPKEVHDLIRAKRWVRSKARDFIATGQLPITDDGVFVPKDGEVVFWALMGNDILILNDAQGNQSFYTSGDTEQKE
jgi:hypothetical protein